VLSLGAGVQSSTLALMAAQNKISPMPDCAIFADTQFEPKNIYEHLNWLETQLPFPVYRVTAGNIKLNTEKGINSTGQKFVSIPFFTEGGGVGRRQCTNEYKIQPIHKKLRELIGLKPRQHAPKKVVVKQWIGISLDEAAMRIKPSRYVWIENVWPLVDMKMSRQDCLEWFKEHYPNKPLNKSSCIGCPFRDDASWKHMKSNDTISFVEAVLFDEAIRDKGHTEKVKKDLFVHSLRKPLSEVSFDNSKNIKQLNFFNEECEGMCGV